MERERARLAAMTPRKSSRLDQMAEMQYAPVVVAECG
jgi:hypothetical protein